MKQLTLIILAFLIINIKASAQQGLSVGLRTGIGKMVNVTHIRSASTTTWDKQLFVRYQTKGRFAFEAGATQYQYGFNRDPSLMSPGFATPTSKTISSRENYSLTDVLVSAQYDITCPYLQEHCPIMKRLRSFIGINTGLTMIRETSTNTGRSFSDGSINRNVYKNTYWVAPIVGLNHTMTYTFNRLYISSVVSYMVQPGYIQPTSYGADGITGTNSKISLRIGLGYRI